MISINKFLVVGCIAVSCVYLYSCKESNESESQKETEIEVNDSINKESKNENEEGINRPSNLRPIPENPFLDSTKYKVGKPKSIKLGL